MADLYLDAGLGLALSSADDAEFGRDDTGYLDVAELLLTHAHGEDSRVDVNEQPVMLESLYAASNSSDVDDVAAPGAHTDSAYDLPGPADGPDMELYSVPDRKQSSKAPALDTPTYGEVGAPEPAAVEFSTAEEPVLQEDVEPMGFGDDDEPQPDAGAACDREHVPSVHGDDEQPGQAGPVADDQAEELGPDSSDSSDE